MSDSERTAHAQPTAPFVRLFLASENRVYAYIYSLLPNWAEADEIFQETSLVLWQKFEEYKPDTDFIAWACRIAYFKVLHHRRSQARSRVVFDEEFLECVSQEQLAQAGEEREQHQALLHCLEKLTDSQRSLLDRCYQPGTTTKSVAEELQSPVDTIYKKLKRLRKTLFDCIQGRLEHGGEA